MAFNLSPLNLHVAAHDIRERRTIPSYIVSTTASKIEFITTFLKYNKIVYKHSVEGFPNFYQNNVHSGPLMNNFCWIFSRRPNHCKA